MKRNIYALTVTMTVAAAGCADQTPSAPSVSVNTVSVDKSKYVLASEPAGAIGVVTAREEVEDDQAVVIVGRIGGSAKPWIEGRAAFVLADAAALAEACADGHCEEGCTKPCCARDKELFSSTALVKFIDEQGRTLPLDARQLFNIKEKDMVVVRGIAKRDDAGNLTVLADGLYLRN